MIDEKTPRSRESLPVGVAKVLKRLHCPVEVILQSVRWYVAYSLSLRDLEEMLAERGMEAHHSTVHRWVIIDLSINHDITTRLPESSTRR
jgi:putative transposase